MLVIFFLPSFLALCDRLVMWDWYGAIERRRAAKKGLVSEGVQGTESEILEDAEDPFSGDEVAVGGGDAGKIE